MRSAHAQQFSEEGYVVVPDVFSPEALEPLRREFAEIVDATTRQLAAEGAVRNLHEGATLEKRLSSLLQDHPETLSTYLRAIGGPPELGGRGKALFEIISHPRLLDCLEPVLGSEIVAFSSCGVRPKTKTMGPGLGDIPWHQDGFYYPPETRASLIVTCWVPLVNATEENGCLQVLPRAHHSIVEHQRQPHIGVNWAMPEADLQRAQQSPVTVPVPLGGVLVMTNGTPHRSAPNTTDETRWSLDLRYAGAPEFVEDVACGEADRDDRFVVRTKRHPEHVCSYEHYVGLRSTFDAAQREIREAARRSALSSAQTS
jgi:ectoine hydroxylase-related dioxygenase (phytanoyl-CoA dioxygenase family)